MNETAPTPTSLRKILVRLGGLFVIFLACTIGFVSLADEVTEGSTLAFDEAVLVGINDRSTSYLDTFFVVSTQLGGVIGVAAITIGIFIAFLLRHRYRWATILAAGVAGAALINVILKLIFERVRPDLWDQLIVETSFSFPSGHAMASSALAFSLIVVAWKTRYRWMAIGLGALFIIVIGLSRLYLGVHYPSDVFAGWLVSAAWVSLVVLAVNGWRGARRVRARKAA